MTHEELKGALTWEPKVEGAARNEVAPRIVVGGMGGSALPAHAARFLDATFPVSVHRDYDLPEDAAPDALYIALSYSGNTAETLSFARAARAKGYALAAITSGGELLEFAQQERLPFVVVPGGVQPRNAVFHQLRALLALAGREDLLSALAAVELPAEKVEYEAGALAQTLSGALPLWYAARPNGFLAYVSKIQCNETAKMPSFANLFPELNHNEMQSFDTFAPEAVASLARFVLLRSTADDARVARRMDVFAELVCERGRSVTDVQLEGATRAELLAYGWYLAHRTALALAEARGVDPNTVPMVEDFKKRL